MYETQNEQMFYLVMEQKKWRHHFVLLPTPQPSVRLINHLQAFPIMETVFHKRGETSSKKKSPVTMVT